MTYQKLPFKPGIYKDDSALAAQGYWIDGDKVRFDRGLPETIYGWEKASNNTLLGYCRGAMTWGDNARNPYAAFGTHLRCYVMDVDGNTYDITPVLTRTFAVSISFTTVLASTTVTAAWTAHGLIVGQKFTFDSATVSPIGGVVINGDFAVLAVTDANTITFTAALAASASAGPTASTVNTTTYLAPGQTDGLGGLGYGTGAYGTGGYGSSASGYTLYPRTWSFAPWGQNLLANPRGGGIYEWAPNLNAAELNPDITFATGWTAGTGWTLAASTATAAAGSGSDLSASVTLQPGAWHLLQFDYTRSAGTLQPKVNAVSQGSALSAASGHPYLIFYSSSGGAKTVAFTKDATFAGTVTNVSVKVLLVANIVTNAPTQCTCIFTTGERIVVACGVPDSNGNFDAMTINWTDTQNNQTWTPAGSNLAGSYVLTNGSRIVRGLPGNTGNYILTDNALYVMTYVPDPTVVYSFQEVGSACGLIGPNAAIQVGGRLFWLSNNGEFMVYDGSYPRPLKCTLRRDMWDNIAWVQQDKVFCGSVAGRNEVWWFYPDGRDGTECSRYVIYNFVEDHWSSGTFNRTAYIDQSVFQYPLAIDTSGSIWFHEKGATEDGGARSWSITSASTDVTDGAQHFDVQGIIPDASGQQGNYTVQMNASLRNSTGIATQTFGPYTIMTSTGKVSFRATGQQIQFAFSGNSSPAFWRLGAMRYDVVPNGRTR